MRVLVAGSHGLIGTALVERLEELGHTVVPLVRTTAYPGEISWASVDDPQSDDLEGFDAVIHLGGVSIGEKRLSTREKARIWDSRIDTTESLAKRLANLVVRPEVFIVGSAVGYYGSQGSKELTENSPAGTDFLAQVCENWEDATKHASAVGIRVCNLRSGTVLSDKGGALGKQLVIFKLGMAGRLGSGTQMLSWISLRDEVEAIIHLLTHKKISGPVNLTSPNPVTNYEYTKTVGRALNRPTLIPVWPWMLHIAFGKQLADDVLLASIRVAPKKLLASGFQFQDPELEGALAQIFKPVSNSNDEGEDGIEDAEILDLDLGVKKTKRRKKK